VIGTLFVSSLMALKR